MASFNDQEYSRLIIMDNYEHPNKKVDTKPNGYLEFNNNSESCIDNISVYLKIESDIVVDALFSGIGCAVSTASTNILCNLISNKPIKDVKLILDNYINMIQSNEYDENIIDTLKVFSNVNKQANRIKCATIGIDATKKIIDGIK